METKVFGEHAFFQMKLPSGADLKEKERFSEKVLNHGAVQKCLGQVTLKGLRRLDYKVVVELQPLRKWSPPITGAYSLRDIAMKMRAGNSRLWQGILRNRNGSYDGFFPGIDPVALERAMEFAEDPAGYIKCFLVRQ